MERIKVAILGPGNIGSDLMYKVFRSEHLEMGLMAGIAESEGIKRARSLGVPASVEGNQGFELLGKHGIKVVSQYGNGAILE